MTNDMRAKIADEIAPHCHASRGQLLAAADAIIAALPDMVPDLEWKVNSDLGEGGYVATTIGGTVYHAMSDGWSLHRMMRWIDANGIESAKAAANAHHRAQALPAFGIAGIAQEGETYDQV